MTFSNCFVSFSIFILSFIIPQCYEEVLANVIFWGGALWLYLYISDLEFLTSPIKRSSYADRRSSVESNFWSVNILDIKGNILSLRKFIICSITVTSRLNWVCSSSKPPIWHLRLMNSDACYFSILSINSYGLEVLESCVWNSASMIAERALFYRFYI